ncbi:MAG: GNAT family N-acetyltransferase [Velocimicrobium sp.]
MKNDLIFKKGNERELDKIFDVFRGAVDSMIENKIMQWDEIYPCKSDIANDLRNMQLYVGMIEQEIAVVYALSKEYEEQYKNGKWELSDENFIVVHRLCVDSKFQHRKIGADTLAYIEKQVRRENVTSIRLDVFSKNPFALRMYEKAGYHIVGEVNWRKGMFYLMEKILK